MNGLADLSTFYGNLGVGSVPVFNKLPAKIEHVNWSRFRKDVWNVDFLCRSIEGAKEQGDDQRVESYSKRIAKLLPNIRWDYDIIKKYIDELGGSLSDWEERFVK